MSILNQCDLIIFDCDGVLIDSETLGIASLAQVLQQAGVPATIAMINSCFGLSLPDTLARVAELTGCAVPPGTGEKVWPAARSVFEQALRPTDGIGSVLGRDSLDAALCCIVVTSGTDRPHAGAHRPARRVRLISFQRNAGGARQA